MTYRNFTYFLKNRSIELIGLTLVFAALLLAVSFFSYSPNDPTFLYATKGSKIANLLGGYGSMVADFLLQSFGLVSFLALITIISWGINLIVKKKIIYIVRLKIFYLLLIMTMLNFFLLF